jgi:hypothetical protein
MLAQENGILHVPLKDVPRPVRHEKFEHVWKCGDWSLDDRDDNSIEDAEKNVLAWAGWLAFLRSGGLDGTEASG